MACCCNVGMARIDGEYVGCCWNIGFAWSVRGDVACCWSVNFAWSVGEDAGRNVVGRNMGKGVGDNVDGRDSELPSLRTSTRG